MTHRLLKSAILVIITIALCFACVGSAFAVYSTNATQKVISINVVIPETIGIKGTWDNWESLTAMNYSAGTYTYTRDLEKNDRFKCYATTWFDGSDYTAAKKGNYTITYSAAATKDMSNVSVTANSYTYIIDISDSPSWAFGAGEVFMVWAWISGEEGSWYEATSFDSTTKKLTVTLPVALTDASVVRLNPDYANHPTGERWDYKWNQTGNFSLTDTYLNATIS